MSEPLLTSIELEILRQAEEEYRRVCAFWIFLVVSGMFVKA